MLCKHKTDVVLRCAFMQKHKHFTLSQDRCLPVPESKVNFSTQPFFFPKLFPKENKQNKAKPQIVSCGLGHCNQLNQNWCGLFEVSERFKKRQKRKDIQKKRDIHPSSQPS